MADRFIVWLGETDDGTAATIGGKGQSLDRLARLGARTPPGFCLTVQAFEELLRANRLTPRLRELEREGAQDRKSVV